MKLLLFILAFGCYAASLRADDAITTLSPAAKATMDKLAKRVSGTVKEQRPHGYLISLKTMSGTELDIFVVTDAKANVGDSVQWILYPLGKYSYPTNDSGDMASVLKATDKPGISADYVLERGQYDPSMDWPPDTL